MKDVDRSIELVACGSSAVQAPTYMDWDRQVLEYLGSHANYLSLHRYVDNRAGDTADFLAVTNSIDRQIAAEIKAKAVAPSGGRVYHTGCAR